MEVFKFLTALLQSDDFLHNQSHIHLSVIAAKFYSFVYHSALCSHYEMEFFFVKKPKL